MTEASSTSEPLLTSNMLELNKDLERMIEDIENMSVQLTWMAFDMATLRTSPELGASMFQLEEAFKRCRAAVCGQPKQKLEMNFCTGTTATTFS